MHPVHNQLRFQEEVLGLALGNTTGHTQNQVRKALDGIDGLRLSFQNLINENEENLRIINYMMFQNYNDSLEETRAEVMAIKEERA